ncbi:MAG: hypothetical protein WD029_01265 [Microthrixaceae bacterium]
MRRFAAVLLAVGMIFGSLALRNSVETAEESADSSASGSGGDSAQNADGRFRLLCASDLEEICTKLGDQNESLIVSFETAGTTADRLTELNKSEDPGFEAWLTVGPWEKIVQDNRSFANDSDQVLAEPSKVLASSETVIMSLTSAQPDVEQACGGPITWKCLGENQTLPKPQSIGIPSPNTGLGLAVLADATNSYFGNSEYSSVDFESEGFPAWFEQLTQKSRTLQQSSVPLLGQAVAKQGAFTTVGAVSAQVQSLPNSTKKYTQVSAPAEALVPSVQAQVRLVPAVGQTAKGALDQVDSKLLINLLAEAKWNTDPVEKESNLPSAGVLQLLREMWDL